MILGCSRDELPPVALTDGNEVADIVVKTVRQKCPRIDDGARREAKIGPPSQPAPPVRKSQTQAWIDRSEVLIHKKNAVISRLIQEADRCRDEAELEDPTM